MAPKLVWMHVVVNARCSWMHGDTRGFRNRGHRIHSGGDYKKRPPSGEHAGFLEYHKSRSGAPVSFDEQLRIYIAREFVLKVKSLGYRVIACAVAENHLHTLVELPNDYPTMKSEIGKCKQKASHAVRDYLPGSIWADGGDFKRIADLDHLHNTYNYIRTNQNFGTVVWSHRDDEDWILSPIHGVIVMGPNQNHLRYFDAGL